MGKKNLIKWDCIGGKNNIIRMPSASPICGCGARLRGQSPWFGLVLLRFWCLLMKAGPAGRRRSPHFLMAWLPNTLLVLLLSWMENLARFFHFTFQILISLLINMLHSQTHTERTCFVPGQTNENTAHMQIWTIGKEWIWMFELNFNYTSKTWIHFILNTVHFADGASLLGHWPLPQILVPSGVGDNLSGCVCLEFAFALSNIVSVLLFCLSAQPLSSVPYRTRLEWLSASPFTRVLHSAGHTQLQPGLATFCLSCFLLIDC